MVLEEIKKLFFKLNKYIPINYILLKKMDIRLKKINDLLQKGLISQQTYLESFDLLRQIPNEARKKPSAKPLTTKLSAKRQSKTPVPIRKASKRRLPGDDHLKDQYIDELLSESPDNKQKSEGLLFERTPFAIGNFLRGYVMNVPSDHDYAKDAKILFDGTQKILKDKLIDELKELKGVKFQLALEAELIEQNSNGEDVIAISRFNDKIMAFIDETQIDDEIKEAKYEILKRIENFMREGSGCIFERVLRLYLNIARYQPIHGSSYIDLPQKIKRKQAIINVKNTDNKCFQWAILAALHPVKVHAERVGNYIKFEKELDFDGIEFPVTIDKISRFEKRNNIAVSVFGLENSSCFPVYISHFEGQKHINLLLISNSAINHDCWIKDLNRLLYDQTNNHERK